MPPISPTTLAKIKAAAPLARVLEARPERESHHPAVAVVSAGTSDLPVAEEAAVVLEHLGHPVDRVHLVQDGKEDVGSQRVAEWESTGDARETRGLEVAYVVIEVAQYYDLSVQRLTQQPGVDVADRSL